MSALLEHAMSDQASMGFARLVACPAPGCHDGELESGFACEICGGSGRVMPCPLDEVVVQVTTKLQGWGYRGTFEVEKTAARLLARWPFEASRLEERRALSELERALWAAGHRATALPELHYVAIYTDETRPVGDVECLHNGEPASKTVAECRAEEAALAAE